MPLKHLLFDFKFRSAWGRTLQLWKPLAVWTLLVWFVLTITVIPLTSALVHWGFILGNQLVISNHDILSWVFTPSGLTYILLLGGLTIVASVIRFAGIFQIVTCHMRKDPITVKQLALEILPITPKLFRLSIFTIAAALAITAFILSGIGIIYLIFLNGQDINYYLEASPPEWTTALIVAGFWLLITGGITLYVLARSAVALPAFLNCNITISKAIKNSWSIMGRQYTSILKKLGFTAITWFLLIFLTDLILLSATTYALQQVSTYITSPRTVTSIAGAYFIVSQVIKSIIGFLGFSFNSVLITKFYHEDSNLQKTAPPAPDFSQIKATITSAFDRYYSPMRAFFLMLGLTAAGLGLGSILTAGLPDQNEIRIIAHRAGPPPAPENTLAALELAISEGAHITEIDVMRSADGTVIVFHDRDMMRMARDPRRIEDVNYSDIRSLTQIPESGFPPEERRIATLEEILLRGKDRIEFMIELKYYNFDPLLAEDVATVVRQTGMTGQVSIASLQVDPILNLTKLAPDISTGYISAISIGNLASVPFDYIAVQHQQITGNLLQSARDRGLKVYAWTVNQPGRIAEMVNIGVDGIITDTPDRVRFLINEMNDMTVAERLLLNITGWQGELIEPAFPDESMFQDSDDSEN